MEEQFDIREEEEKRRLYLEEFRKRQREYEHVKHKINDYKHRRYDSYFLATCLIRAIDVIILSWCAYGAFLAIKQVVSIIVRGLQ